MEKDAQANVVIIFGSREGLGDLATLFYISHLKSKRDDCGAQYESLVKV